LRGSGDRGLGALARAFAVPLQELLAHLQRADQDANGASAQKGALARACAGDDRRPKLGENGRALRRSSDHGVSLGAPAADKPRTLSGIVEADETFILESFKGRRSDLPRRARKRGGTARHPGLHQDNIPILVARDQKGATFDAVLPQDDSASIAAALAGVVTPRTRLIGDGGKPLPSFARQANIPFHGPCPRPASRPPRRLTSTSTTSTPITAASNNGSTASTASPPKTCPTISASDAPSKPGVVKSRRRTGSRAPSEMDLTNN
jgi:hypothetical protein